MGMKCCGCMTPKHLQLFGLFFLTIASIMAVLSLVLPFWRTGDDYEEGLYYYRTGGSCHRLSDIVYGDEGWWRFCQIMHPICTFAAVVATGLGWLYTWKKSNGQTMDGKLPLAVNILACVSAVLFVGIQLAYSMGVFRKDKGHKQHFCYYVLHALTPLLIIGGVWLRQSYVYLNRCVGNEKKSACGF